MGDAKDRGTKEERAASALERERAAIEAKRREWADEMVADAAALLDAAARHADAAIPPCGDDLEQRGERAISVGNLAAHLSSIAAQRAVATDLLEALTDDEEPDEDDGEDYDPPTIIGPPAHLRRVPGDDEFLVVPKPADPLLDP